MKKLLFVVGIALALQNFSLFADDTELTYQNTQYVCTGVGESKEDARWKAYPLKLIFTAAGRAYVAEVSATIKDGAGNVVLQTTCDAPWLLVKLKPGRYFVTATAEGGGTKTATVNVPSSGQHEWVIRFSGIRVE